MELSVRLRGLPATFLPSLSIVSCKYVNKDSLFHPFSLFPHQLSFHICWLIYFCPSQTDRLDETRREMVCLSLAHHPSSLSSTPPPTALTVPSMSPEDMDGWWKINDFFFFLVVVPSSFLSSLSVCLFFGV